MHLRDLIAPVGVALLLLATPFAANAVVPDELKATPEPNKLGLAIHDHRFRWNAPDQHSYQILVASDAKLLALDRGDLWNSGRRMVPLVNYHSEEVPDRGECLYRGKPFPAETGAWWKVRIWNAGGEPGKWSEPEKIEIPGAASSAKPIPRPTATRGAIDFVEGKFGKAVRLGDGAQISASDYGDLREPSTTIAAWIKPDQTPDTWQCIYRKDDGARRLLAIGAEGPFWGLWCGFVVNGRYVEFGAPYDAAKLGDGGWHHVAATFSLEKVRLYVDGEMIGEQVQPGTLSSGGTAPAFIGSHDGKAEFFKGAIDDLRIYGGGLDKGEIGKLVAGNPDEVDMALVAHWKFDGSATNEAIVVPEVAPHRVVLLGGTVVYEMEKHGHFEHAVTARWPHHDITFRNLGWPADDVFGTARGEFESARGPGTWRPEGGDPGAGYGELLAQVRAAKPTSLIVSYGAEAAYAETDEQMINFEAGYRRLIGDLEATGAKLILMTPLPQSKMHLGSPATAVADQVPARNKRLEQAAALITELGKDRGYGVADLRRIFKHPMDFRSTFELSDSGHTSLGYQLARVLCGNPMTVVGHDERKASATSVVGLGMRAEEVQGTKIGVRFSLTLDQLPTAAWPLDLFGSGFWSSGLYHRGQRIGGPSRREKAEGRAHSGPDIEQAEELRQVILRKNAYHRAKLRPINRAYIFLFRRHEMEHFAGEMEEYEDLIEDAEEQIALLRVPRTHRHEFRGDRTWTAPRDYPDHEVPKPIPAPNVEEELAAMTVADGFQVNLFAKNPMIANPINLNWDTRGRAWVSTSSTYPHPRPDEKPDDRIVILEDTDGDGVADKHTVFAEGLLVPHSVMPVKGGAYVCSATEFLFLADADGDDVSESRRVVFSGFGNADVHHMIHGLRWAPWGDLHFVQSIYINSFVDTPHGPQRINGSGVWRFRPEKLRLVPFATGMVNPWGFTFDRWGQSFGTDGAGGQGPHYVFPGAAFNSASGAHRTLGGLVPGKPKNTAAEIMSGRHIPDHWQGSLLANDFRANRTVRYEMKAQGSGYTAKEVETVLHSSHRSFRPVDIKMGPDGAVYVVDWYNGIIDHGEVDFYHPLRDKKHGRIWRITAKDRPLVERPTIAGAPVENLLEMLIVPEDYTRNQAKRELASRPGQGLIGPVSNWAKNIDPDDPQFEHHRLEALWLLISHRAASANLVEAILHSPSPQARAAAARAVANWDSRSRKVDQIALLAKAVEDEHPQVRLEAVNGLRGLGTLEAANVALRARSHPTDNYLDYALELTVRKLRDQWLPAMQSGKRVFDGDPARLSYALKEVGDARAISRLLELVTTGAIEAEGLPQTVATIAALGEPGDLEALLALAKKKPRLFAAIAAGATNNDHVPANSNDVVGLLDAKDAGVVAAAAELAGIWKVADAQPRLVNIAKASKGTDADLLATVCRALGRTGAIDDLKQLSTAGRSPALRANALAAWARLEPDNAAAPAVALLSKLDDPAQAVLAIDAFLDHDSGAASLAKALESASLKEAVAITCVQSAHASGRDMASLIAALNKAGGLKLLSQNFTTEERRALLGDVTKIGDATRGREIYLRENLACAACHLVDNRGGKVGPDLTTLGTYATPESLLESLLNPSTTIKQGYETVVVTKKDSTVIAGLLQRRTDNATLVRDPAGKVIAIPTGDIAKVDHSPISLMPPGLTASLRRDELVDLMRYLTSLGKGSKKAEK